MAICCLHAVRQSRGSHVLTRICCACAHLSQIDGSLRVTECDSLTSLVGLNHLRHIGHNLELFRNDRLVSLEGLDALREVVGHIHIVGNAALINLTALASLRCHGGVAAATDIDVPAWLENKPTCESLV